jgi:hypothetical protein
MTLGGDRRIYKIGQDTAGRFASPAIDPSGAAKIHREFQQSSRGAFRMTFFLHERSKQMATSRSNPRLIHASHPWRW